MSLEDTFRSARKLLEPQPAPPSTLPVVQQFAAPAASSRVQQDFFFGVHTDPVGGRVTLTLARAPVAWSFYALANQGVDAMHLGCQVSSLGGADVQVIVYQGDGVTPYADKDVNIVVISKAA